MDKQEQLERELQLHEARVIQAAKYVADATPDRVGVCLETLRTAVRMLRAVEQDWQKTVK